VSITVTAVNDPPRASDDRFVTMEDVKLTVSASGVLVNDSDIDSSSLQAVIEAQAAHGTVSLSSDGSFVYTPALDFSGADSFAYHVSDGSALKAIATVSIAVVSVNDRPIATNDGFQGEANVSLVVAAPRVLMNDSDSDDDLLRTILASGPSHGQLTLNDDGSFTYSPDSDFHGLDSFAYRASDGTVNRRPSTGRA
jgi:VCBS repeat-containing protein